MSLKKILQFLETVDQPKDGNERAFKRKHFVQKFDYPVENENVFTAVGIEKDRTKDASYEDGEDEDVYEEADLSEADNVRTNRADKEAVIVHSVDPKTGQSKTYSRRQATGEITVGKKTVSEEVLSKSMSKEDKDKAKLVHQTLKNGEPVSQSFGYQIKMHKKQLEMKYGKDWKTLAGINEELSPLEEISKKMLGRYIKAAGANREMNLNATTFHGQQGYEVFKREPTAKAKELASAHYDKASKHAMKAAHRKVGIDKAVDRLVKEETFEEAFNPGKLNLKDGSTISLTTEQAQALNGLFNQLSSSNKSKMEEKVLADKKGFNEILSFAKEI